MGVNDLPDRVNSTGNRTGGSNITASMRDRCVLYEQYRRTHRVPESPITGMVHIAVLHVGTAHFPTPDEPD